MPVCSHHHLSRVAMASFSFNFQFAQGQAPEWSVEDIEEELIVQCSELLPGLLAKRAETGGESEEAAAKRKEREEKQAKEAAEKREKEKAEKKAAKEKEAAEKKAAKEKQEEEKRQQKEAAAAEKEKRDKEKAEEKAKKDAEKAKKDEEKAKRDAEKAKQKEEEDKKKAEEKAAKEEEAAKKREEAAKKKEEEDKKKAEEKAKKDEEAAKKREEAAKKKEEEDKKKAEEKAKKDEEEKKKREEKEAAAAEKKRKEDEKAAAKEKEQDEKMKDAPEDDKKKYEEKKKAEKERKQKAEAEAKQKEEERKKKEEEKAAAAVKREEERKKKEEEDAKKKEEDDKKKAEQKAIDDEKKAVEKEKAKKQKEEDDKKKAEEKAKKEIEDKKKKEEAAKKKEEDDKKKAEEKAKKDEENKKKKEAAAKEKEEKDKKKAEEKAAQDAKDKKRKEEEDKRKAEQKRKDDERKQKEKENDEQRKKKEQERKEKEKERAAKRKEEEEKRKEEQKQRKREEDQKKEKEQRDKETQAREEKKEEKQKKKKEKKKKKQMGDGSSDEEWDEETGTMRKKINPINSRSAIQDGCCNESCAGCCRGLSIIFYIMFIPLIFAGLCFYEYNTYGFARVLDRSMGKDPDCWPDGPPPEGKMLQIPGCDDDGKEGVEFEALQRFLLAKEPGAAAAPKAAPEPKAAPKAKAPPKAGPKGAAGAEGEEEGIDYAAIAAEFAEANPYCWIMPLIGLVMGIFSNIMPIAGGLILMPLFEELEITKSSEETLALACMAQFVNSGVLGMFSWCGRDARLFICRALCMLIPIGWLGYAVGVTNNLSFKDMLIAIYKEVDDDSFLEDLNEADISLLHTYMRLGFGVFMMFMSFLVMFGCCIGGMNRCCCPSNTGGTTPGCKSFCQWIIVWALTFNTGYLFVANIGVGMGMCSFFLLSIFLGVEHKRAAPTAIVIGAWVSLAPALANWIVLEASPYIRLMMMVPGMWFGALFAPWFSKCGGPMCDLTLFFFALAISGAAVTAYAAIKIQEEKEDVDINIAPMYSIPVVDEWFEKRTERLAAAKKG